MELLKGAGSASQARGRVFMESRQSITKVTEWRNLQDSLAQSVGLVLVPVEAQTPAELDRAFAAIKHERPDAMIRNNTESLTARVWEKIGRIRTSPTDCPW